MSAIRCTACKRLLGVPAVQIKTRTGSLAMGPKCARRAGLLASRRLILSARLGRAQAVPVDSRQMALELEGVN